MSETATKHKRKKSHDKASGAGDGGAAAAKSPGKSSKSSSSSSSAAAAAPAAAAAKNGSSSKSTSTTTTTTTAAAAANVAAAAAGGASASAAVGRGPALFPVSADPAKVPEHEVIYADAASFDAHRSVRDCFEQLDYGPAPEDSSAAHAWLDDHQRRFGHFINNEWVHGDRYRKSYCPGTGEFLAETVDGTDADVDRAVKAARKAYVKWSALSGHERAKHLYAVARHVQKHQRLLAIVEALDNGKSIRETRDSDVPLVARHFYHHAGWAQLRDTELAGWAPLGVIGEIVPWNFPLMLLTWKVCPALAMGNTVVLKPASYTRLSALLFAEICAEAGLPPGVFNLITGSGAMGSTLADHPDVDKVAFTGSTPIGRLLRQRIAGSGKKISLELGGKSPVVVFDNADLDSAVEGTVDAIYFNQGQVCCAGSRLIVHESIAERFVAKLKTRINHFRVGMPLDKSVDSGALVDKSQYTSIKAMLERARAGGAEVYVARVPVPNCGYYWPPTIVTNVSPVAECVREEIFGPVLTVLTFRSPEEAIALANNTFFGLGGSVWTEDISLALEVAINIKAGVIWINSHNLFDAAGGFGGYRESGFGRDGGREGLYEYVKPAWKPKRRVQPKALTFPCTATEWPSLVMPRPASVEASAKAAACAAATAGAAGAVRVDKTHKMYIGGAQKRPDQSYSRPVLAPGGGVLGLVGEGNRKDVRDAVAAAHKAAGGWGKRAAHNRAQICYYIAENLQERFDEFAARIVAQTGRERASAEREVTLSIERLFYYAAYADKFGGEVKETTLYGLTVAIHEPVGVMCLFCPDDYPLLGFVSLVAPCLVRGNTVVVCPSTPHPLSAVDLYEVFETSDLPAGVVNIVTGERDFIAKTCTQHMDVEAVWYHGPSELGSRNVEFDAAQNMKRTFVNYGQPRDWESAEQGQGDEFLREAVEIKNVWAPMGAKQR